MGLRFRRRKAANSEGELREILGNAELPTFPNTVLRTLQILRDPDSEAADIAKPLSADPGLTAQILRLVNSVAFSPRRPITAIEQGVAMAGRSAVESLVLAAGVGSAVPATSVDGFDPSRFWTAASQRAVMAKALARCLHPETADLCFTAGLLQDMAVPLLVTNRSDYSEVLVQWHQGDRPLHELEEERFGWNHGLVAGWLCEEWGLPAQLTEAIGNHNDPEASIPPALHLVAPLREVNPEVSIEQIVGQTSSLFGLPETDIRQIVDESVTQASELAELLN